MTDIGFSTKKRIYIKENLTPTNYKIFQSCAVAKRNNLLTKYFTRDGMVFITTPTIFKALAIHSIDFLNETLNLNSNTMRAPKPKSGITKSQKAKMDVDEILDITTSVTGSTIQSPSYNITQPTLGQHSSSSSSVHPAGN